MTAHPGPARSPIPPRRPARPQTSPRPSSCAAARWYGNVVAVNDVSFTLGAGVTGLLGPNGAGKTTVLHMLAGFLAPSAGRVRVLGRGPHRDPSVYRQIGLVPEREAVYPFLTGLDYVRFNARLQGMRNADAAARRAVALVGLEDSRTARSGRTPRECGNGSRWPGPRPRSSGAPVGRAVQWHGSPQPHFHDGPARDAGGAGSDDPLLVAHPRGGRTRRDRDPGDGGRPPRGIRRLPGNPNPDDRPAAQHHRPVQRRSTAGHDPDGRPVRLRGRIDAGRALGPDRPARGLPQARRGRQPRGGVRLLEVVPADESLESVFDYLVRR